MFYIYKVDNRIFDTSVNSTIISQEKLIAGFTKSIEETNAIILESTTNGLKYSSRNSLFRINYNIEIEAQMDSESVSINYQIHLLEMFKVNIVVALIAIFFSRMSIVDFTYFFLLIFLSFYFLNRLLIVLNVRNLIIKIISELKPQASIQELSDTFMTDLNGCPACGYHLDGYEINCPSCGLRLPKRKGVRKPIPSSGSELNITYDFKPKKEEKK